MTTFRWCQAYRIHFVRTSVAPIVVGCCSVSPWICQPSFRSIETAPLFWQQLVMGGRGDFLYNCLFVFFFKFQAICENKKKIQNYYLCCPIVGEASHQNHKIKHQTTIKNMKKMKNKIKKITTSIRTNINVRCALVEEENL